MIVTPRTMDESARLNVGQRNAPSPTSGKLGHAPVRPAVSKFGDRTAEDQAERTGDGRGDPSSGSRQEQDDKHGDHGARDEQQECAAVPEQPERRAGVVAERRSGRLDEDWHWLM